MLDLAHLAVRLNRGDNMSFLIPIRRPDPNILGRLGRLTYWTSLFPVAILLIFFAIQEMEPPTPLPDTSALMALQPQYPGQRPNEIGGYAMSDEAKHQIAVDRAAHVNHGLPGPVFLVMACIVFLVGRGVRYLFAGE